MTLRASLELLLTPAFISNPPNIKEVAVKIKQVMFEAGVEATFENLRDKVLPAGMAIALQLNQDQTEDEFSVGFEQQVKLMFGKIRKFFPKLEQVSDASSQYGANNTDNGVAEAASATGTKKPEREEDEPEVNINYAMRTETSPPDELRKQFSREEQKRQNQEETRKRINEVLINKAFFARQQVEKQMRDELTSTYQKIMSDHSTFMGLWIKTLNDFDYGRLVVLKAQIENTIRTYNDKVLHNPKLAKDVQVQAQLKDITYISNFFDSRKLEEKQKNNAINFSLVYAQPWRFLPIKLQRQEAQQAPQRPVGQQTHDQYNYF